MPPKELYTGIETPTFNYTSLNTLNQDVNPHGIIGIMANFTLDYAVAWFTDECLSNLLFCHNGWSVNLWLLIHTPVSSLAREVLLTSQMDNTQFGLIIYGQQTDGSFYYVTVVVKDCRTETKVTFQTTTFSWTHLYIAVDGSQQLAVYLNGRNNTYLTPSVTEVVCVEPGPGRTRPVSVGARADGQEQMSAFIDELEIFEFAIPDPDEVFKNSRH